MVFNRHTHIGGSRGQEGPGLHILFCKIIEACIVTNTSARVLS